MHLEYLSHSIKSLAGHIHVLRRSRLWLQVLIGLFLGVIFGILIGPDFGLVELEKSRVIAEWIALPGEIFLQLIKMVIIPLIFSSIVLGIVSSGDPKFLKKVGLKVFAYFVITTVIAILIGIGVASLIKPGNYIDIKDFDLGADLTIAKPASIELIDIPGKIVEIFPQNPFASIVNGDLLGVVIFTILFGVALLFVSRKYLIPTSRVLRATQEATMKIVSWVMLIAPLAVFGLMAKISSQVGVHAFLGLGMYIFTVVIGLFLVYLMYLAIVGVFTWSSPLSFIRAVAPVQLLAFSTSSSAAVMPLSMKTAEEDLKVKPIISRFLIPIGATINMNGTALYQVVATMFLAQVFGIELAFTTILAIIAITVAASIGSPGVPGIGIIILATILESAGIPASGIALIIGVDRILDMNRTAINVTGDLAACKVFDRYHKED